MLSSLQKHTNDAPIARRASAAVVNLTLDGVSFCLFACLLACVSASIADQNLQLLNEQGAISLLVATARAHSANQDVLPFAVLALAHCIRKDGLLCSPLCLIVSFVQPSTRRQHTTAALWTLCLAQCPIFQITRKFKRMRVASWPIFKKSVRLDTHSHTRLHTHLRTYYTQFTLLFTRIHTRSQCPSVPSTSATAKRPFCE